MLTALMKLCLAEEIKKGFLYDLMRAQKSIVFVFYRLHKINADVSIGVDTMDVFYNLYFVQFEGTR